MNQTDSKEVKETQAYLDVITNALRVKYGTDYKRVTTLDAMTTHMREGWEATKFVDYIVQKFNLSPVPGMV